MRLTLILGRALFWFGVAAVVVASILPGEALPTIPLWDKLQHAGTYAGLALLGGISHRTKGQRLAVFAGLVALGGLLEVAQHFIPGREASPADAFANALGVAAGILISFLAERRAPFATAFGPSVGPDPAPEKPSRKRP